MVRQQHEQLLHSDRLATVGELAAGLAHELRNPLAGMAGALHVLDGQLPGDDPRHELVSDLQAQIKRMNKTLSDLLQHARPARAERRAVELNALVDESLLFLPRGNVEIVRRYDAAPRVDVDPHLLHQALLNILVNARQAMPHGGRLTVETRLTAAPAHGVEIAISDTGTGINPEHVDHIFKPFFTTKTQGTGLGLAIAARIVEQHGGRIEVESTPGVGTTFCVVLPATAVQPLVRSEAYAT
ncbi:MAG: hypothetical protein HY216_05010 [Candidatus Rokubacteria bacterium]|nr:hypothetical protein [Candidatus Rokubacteria bacterium]